MIQFSRPFLLLILLALPLIFLVKRHHKRSLILRTLTLALIVVSLAGPESARRFTEHRAIFLIDRSASITETTDIESVRDQIAAVVDANPNYTFGSISFADTAKITEPVSDRFSATVTSDDLGVGTNLATAVDLALADAWHDRDTQLILVSDGRITEGLDQGLATARQVSVPICVLPVGTEIVTDLRMTKLVAPPVTTLNRPFTISATIVSKRDAQATLAVYRGNELLSASDVAINAGSNKLTLTDSLPSEGAYQYRISIKQEDDPIFENDTLTTTVHTTTLPNLLVVDPRDDAPVLSLLRAIGAAFVHKTSVPSISEIAAYHEILISDVNLADIPQQVVADLDRFVSDLGGGLLVIEGEKDVRGYAGGGIEDVLPISYTVPQKARTASMAIVFLLDRSASMRSRAQDAAKIDILKEAVAASVNLLDKDALVGVIAFNRDYQWLVPIQPVGDGSAIYDPLRSLEATGGTDIYYPIVAALNALDKVSARTKHVILFSDGKTIDEYRDYEGLFARLQGGDITLSAIAIGKTPNIPLLTSLIQAGHGPLYRAVDVTNLPQVSIEATQRLSRSRFVNGNVAVKGPLATGELSAIPEIRGHLLSYAKPSADVLLWAGEDPLFARWRMGSGQVAVLNTDLDGNWSDRWLAWGKAGLLLDTMLSSVEPITTSSLGLTGSGRITDGQIEVLADARNEEGGFANFLDLRAHLVSTGDERSMEQVAPGLYRAVFPAPCHGDCTIMITDNSRHRSTLVPMSLSYPAEYAGTGIDEETLHEIADATGGKILQDEVLPQPSTAKEMVVSTDIHSHFLIASLILFLADLVWRKIPLRRG